MLTELGLGRAYDDVPLQLRGKRPLDVRAMGDLSRFPGLCKLTFCFCEVVLCCSVLGAAQHASLTGLCFDCAHPAPECAPAVLQLSRELWRLGRGSVLRAECIEVMGRLPGAPQDAQGHAPCPEVHGRFGCVQAGGMWAVRCWVVGQAFCACGIGYALVTFLDIPASNVWLDIFSARPPARRGLVLVREDAVLCRTHDYMNLCPVDDLACGVKNAFASKLP